MKVKLRQIQGNWDLGYALDKHVISSQVVGHNQSGYPIFDTLRTEAGEASYQLKYRDDWSQAAPLAKAVHDYILPHFPKLGLIIPMAASKWRQRQPVSEVASELAKLVGVLSFDALLSKVKGGKSLKDLKTREEKQCALAEAGFSIAPNAIEGVGPWNALLLDDLYDTGASAEAAVAVLRTHPKLSGIYFAALTWK